MPFVPQENFQFCGATYLAASPVLDSQRSINLYPEPQPGPGAKTRMALIGRPGLSASPFTGGAGVVSPARALWAGDNVLYAVGGTHAYRLGLNASYVDYGAISGSGGFGPCQMVDNGTQLLIMDPSAANIVLVTAPGSALFNGGALEYLDGFYVAIASGASLAGSNPNQINTSNNGDGTTWNPLNFVIRTGSADIPLNLAVVNGQLWILGQKKTEIWYNAGNPGFPFARISGATIDIGILWPYSVAKFLNTVLWVGADARGAATVYMAQGTNAVRVSNFAIENILASFSGNSLQYFPFAFPYEEAGHAFYVICPTGLNGSSQVVPTAYLVYDLTTGLWHERTYSTTVGSPSPCCAAFSSFTSNVYVGDAISNKILMQSIQTPSDIGNPIFYKRTAQHIGDSNRRYSYDRLELDGDMGTASPILDYSNDGGRSFLGRNFPLKQSVDSSIQGTFRRFYQTQLGQSRDRVYQVTISDNSNLIRIANAYCSVTAGTE